MGMTGVIASKIFGRTYHRSSLLFVVVEKFLITYSIFLLLWSYLDFPFIIESGLVVCGLLGIYPFHLA